MRAPTLYGYHEPKTFKSLKMARRAFTHATMTGEKVLLVRENGMTFEATLHNYTDVQVFHFDKLDQVIELLQKERLLY